jgi:hypothetical protein
MPTIGVDVGIPSTVLEGQDNAVLRSVNSVLSRVGKPKLVRVADLLDAPIILTTLAELDPYRSQREGAAYAGAIYSTPYNAPVVKFADNGKPKILVYYSRANFCTTLMGQLAEYDVIYVSPNISTDIMAMYSTDSLKICNTLIDIDALSGEDYVLLSHGNHGLVERTLLQGKLQIVVPTQLEQRGTGVCVNTFELGVCLGRYPKIGEMIDLFREDPKFKNNVDCLAKKYRGLDPLGVATTALLTHINEEEK